MPVKFKTLLYDPSIVPIHIYIYIYLYTHTHTHKKSWYQQMHVSTQRLVHIQKGLLHVSANHVAPRLAENAVFSVKRLVFLCTQRISAACNSVSIEIKVCCEAQQINRIKITGNVDEAQRNRIDRITRGTVILFRKIGQQISEKKKVYITWINFMHITNIGTGKMRNFYVILIGEI